MKKQLLLILSSVVLLGISCTDKISKKEIVTSNKMTDVIKINSSSINSNSIIKSKIKSAEVKNKS